MYYFNDKDNSVTCDIWIMVKERQRCACVVKSNISSCYVNPRLMYYMLYSIRKICIAITT